MALINPHPKATTPPRKHPWRRWSSTPTQKQRGIKTREEYKAEAKERAKRL